MIMTYKNIILGIFISRPNRFIAEVEIEGNIEICHVKNTGRCKELLIPGVTVYVQRADNPNRTTKYDLIAVRKGERLINMDSSAPNKVFLEYLQKGTYIKDVTLIKPEARYGASRFDFYVEAGGRRIFIEVKGVTLEENGVVMFPDAPTERGVKHLNELARCVSEGYEAHVVFVIQMSDVKYFIPNNHTHPAFGAALVAAKQAGVAVAAFDCEVDEDSLEIRNAVEVRL
ncbi:MAG: Sugar fermentation stimulation protein A [Firmicutes bacterium ADurb.Bin193]|nr:MAG: Sugar fermentation stimulation protein A [Firmicutes bacterium ADurb.Bin193]